MEDLLKFLRNINPSFTDLTLQEICESDQTYGYQCFARGIDETPFSGGTSQSKEKAIRIAIAETIERSFLRVINSDPELRETFLMNDYPSSSGFAAGFNDKKTRYRSICEGLERWVWSKWIDEGYILPRYYPDIKFSNLTSFQLKSFSETYWYRNKFFVEITPNEKLDLHIVIFLGCTENGIFPGSRVSTVADDLLEHPVIEAHRNFTNYRVHQSTPLDLIDLIQERTIYYGKNKKLALEQIQKANITNWPQPKIKLLKDYNTNHSDLFLYRCLMEDFIGWHLGDVTRFVY